MVIKGRYAYLLKILCLLILQLLITGAMECYSKADDKIGYLWVTSQPKFALIAIDDEYIDFLTPMKKPINLGTGIHTLQLYVNGYEPYRDKITIKRGQILEIKVTLARSGSSASPAKRYVEAYVTIGSIPAGADVCLDNVKIGKGCVIGDHVIIHNNITIKNSVNICPHKEVNKNINRSGIVA